MDYDYLYIPLKVTPTTKLFLCNKVVLDAVIN